MIWALDAQSAHARAALWLVRARPACRAPWPDSNAAPGYDASTECEDAPGSTHESSSQSGKQDSLPGKTHWLSAGMHWEQSSDRSSQRARAFRLPPGPPDRAGEKTLCCLCVQGFEKSRDPPSGHRL